MVLKAPITVVPFHYFFLEVRCRADYLVDNELRLTSNGWLPMQYNLVEIYRKVIAKMNYDPDQVFEPSVGPSVETYLYLEVIRET